MGGRATIKGTLNWLWWHSCHQIWWVAELRDYFGDKFSDSQILLTNFMTFLFLPNLSLNSSPNSSPKLSLNFVYRQIRQQICHQNHQPIWWPTKFGDRNVTKIITQFGESQNKVTNMSLNFSPNLVMTKFVTKHLGVLYANRGETKYSCAFLCQVCYNQWNWISTEEHCQRHKGPIREAISDAWADLFGHRAGRGKGKRLQG